MTAPARRTVRSGGGCGGARSICPRRRDRWRGRPRLLRGANQVQLSVIVCGRRSSSRGRVPICGPSDRQIGRDLVIPLDQRCNHQYSWSEIEPSCGCPDPGALTMLDQPSTSLRTIVCQQPSDVRQPVINPQLLMMHFLYKIRVTLSSKKCMCFGPEALGGRNERTYMCFARTGANDP